MKNSIKLVFLCFLIMLFLSCENPTNDTSTEVEGTTENPSFSIEEGAYTYDLQLSLSCSNTDARIYYSTTSDVVDETYAEYTGPIDIGETVTVWAYAKAPNMEMSSCIAKTYDLVTDDLGNMIGNGEFVNNQYWLTDYDVDENANSTFSFDTESFFADIALPGEKLWSIGLKYTPFLLIENGKEYTLKFDAKASNTRTIVLGLGENGRDLNENDDIWDKYLYESVSLTTVLTTFTYTFTMNNPTDNNTEFFFWLGLYSGDVTIDNVKLYTNN